MKLQIYDDIEAERRRQDEEWGIQTHSPVAWFTILVEEVGEVAKALLSESPSEWRRELVQVAAVVVATLEAYEEPTK